MALPSWVGDAATPVAHAVADSPHTAPGWLVCERDWYTCVQPVDRIADATIVRWIRAFCPEVIPMWRKQAFLTPGPPRRSYLAVHFALGTYVRDPHRELHLVHVEMPSNAKHPVPNQLEKVFEDTSDAGYLHYGAPPPFEPCDMRVYDWCRRNYSVTKSGRQIAEEMRRERVEKRRRQQEKAAEEFEYRSKDWNKFVQRQLDAPGDTVKEFFRWREKRRARMRERKPFIYVRSQ
jgi:hypothetical protein